MWGLIGQAHITAQAGDEGILMVDTGTAAMSDRSWLPSRRSPSGHSDTSSTRPTAWIIQEVEKIAATGEIIPFDAGDAAKIQTSSIRTGFP